MTAAAEAYHAQLAGSPAALFLEERGLGDEGLQATFLLGYVGEPHPGHEAYRGRLSIPYITPSGVVNFRFRSLDEHGPKYLGSDGTTNLYNVRELLSHGHVDLGRPLLVCEGELDTVAATHAGYPAVGVPGASAWKPHWARLLLDAESVVVVSDGDDAGRQLAKSVRADLEEAIARPLPEGHDVNSFLLAEGVEAFDEWVGVSAT